ncbi:MAG: hypothetical protein H0T13_03855 [Actinobacteria bacterium]|nr:hypothetical protein [Actinomycetota bacterium]
MNSALQPTPLVRGDAIRVFVGFRDADGRSSVGFVDVDRTNPSRVVGTSTKAGLHRGPRGSFDEDGVVPTAIVEQGAGLRLYYAGYQRGLDVRFRAFGGLALSDDGGETFHRHGREPVMGPSAEGEFFRVPHTVMPGPDCWRVWYGAGSEWRKGRDKTLPVYNIRYLESPDGIEFSAAGEVAIPLSEGEYRIGRPYVVRNSYGYAMYFAAATETRGFRLAFATSSDGRHWARRDAEIRLGPSPGSWDSEMVSYPAVVTTEGRTFLFYNGNDYGRAGFGYAELEKDETG